MECVNSIKTYNNRKAASNALPATGKPDFSDAETVEYEELDKKE